MNKIRIDKWLWSVRIFKSRNIASNFCRLGKVNISRRKCKPSSFVNIGDEIQIKKSNITYSFKVLKLLEIRSSYSIARLCYKDLTPLSEIKKLKTIKYLNSNFENRNPGMGRPTKKDRREIEIFKKNEFKIDNDPYNFD
ncbi:MAG: RNA-binding protein [Flavobacteriales bacterium]|nr:RNA-binding protein [Flavobacteriales bacterium]|tara:strand:+ start:5137 stop:5553 length:417 start_codon:yes stop_codon:yes gene_type:complete